MAAIRLESVGVRFPIYDVRARSWRTDLLRRSVGGRIARDQDRVLVQALDDVSLHFTSGDRVGLVGPNGAGKSTLLRVMAGIYHPTTGSVVVDGQVVTLFNLSIGMDLEMTGAENCRMRALLLGCRGPEIDALVEDVARFSELGEYMSLPLRTYSTGMMVRLAFAASTAVRPDLLLMDEMIGAGDAAFFARTEARLHDFLGNVSVMVVASHSEYVLTRWCNKAVLMDQGRVIAVGSVAEILERYAARQVPS